MIYRANSRSVKDNRWLPEGASDVVGPHTEIPKDIIDGMESFAGSYNLQHIGRGYYLEDKTGKIYKRVGGTDEIPVFEEIEVNHQHDNRCYTIS